MPSPELLSFDTLIEPIPGENPAGGSIPFQTRERLEEARKEINPDSFAEDDPHRPTEAKLADWRGIMSLAEETLISTSKDLQVTARLTEALTKEHGFAGLRDGLHLFRLLIDQCWDRLNPSIEDGDLEVRAGPFNWLDDPDRGARFPTSVRTVPLVFGERALGWLDWRQCESAQDSANREAFEKAVLATPREQCLVQVEDLTQGLSELDQLSQSLQAKMDSVAPGLLGLRQAMEDCRVLADQILRRKGPAPAGAAGSPASSAGETGSAAATSAAQGATSREDVYRKLAEAAALLEQIEPHSPIPYLLRRAVELGVLPFPLLMKQLIRDDNVLSVMNRELGIKDNSLVERAAEESE